GAHIFNNSLAVTVAWLISRGSLPASAETFGAGSYGYLAASLLLTALLVWRLSRNFCGGK
ncbi:MAG: hypothetical protein K2M97_02385, partial [Muribaculaceae bacterium]|nr:hypothetical protein [Muribaculaceae bacterium]